MGVLLIIAAAVALIVWNRSSFSASGGTITTTEAQAQVDANQQIQQQIQQQALQVEQQVAVDVDTAKSQVLKLGESLTGIAITGLTSAATATTTGTLLLSATAWTVVGAIVGGMLVLVNALRSETHLYANALVKNYENPFGGYVIQAQQAMQAGYSNGTLTSADAAAITNAVIISWAKYMNGMKVFQAKGGDWNVVATQSLQNLDSGEGMNGTFYLDKSLPKTALGNGFMTYWIRWMQETVQRIASEGR